MEIISFFNIIKKRKVKKNEQFKKRERRKEKKKRNRETNTRTDKDTSTEWYKYTQENEYDDIFYMDFFNIYHSIPFYFFIFILDCDL